MKSVFDRQPRRWGDKLCRWGVWDSRLKHSLHLLEQARSYVIRLSPSFLPDYDVAQPQAPQRVLSACPRFDKQSCFFLLLSLSCRGQRGARWWRREARREKDRGDCKFELGAHTITRKWIGGAQRLASLNERTKKKSLKSTKLRLNNMCSRVASQSRAIERWQRMSSTRCCVCRFFPIFSSSGDINLFHVSPWTCVQRHRITKYKKRVWNWLV